MRADLVPAGRVQQVLPNWMRYQRGPVIRVSGLLDGSYNIQYLFSWVNVRVGGPFLSSKKATEQRYKVLAQISFERFDGREKTYESEPRGRPEL